MILTLTSLALNKFGDTVAVFTNKTYYATHDVIFTPNKSVPNTFVCNDSCCGSSTTDNINTDINWSNVTISNEYDIMLQRKQREDILLIRQEFAKVYDYAGTKRLSKKIDECIETYPQAYKKEFVKFIPIKFINYDSDNSTSQAQCTTGKFSRML